MKILYEDDHILVCEKPAGIATQAGKVTEKDMVSEVNNYLRKAGAKSPAYLVHRLDKPVRGVLLFAKTKEAASKLSGQITDRSTNKKYYALVEGYPEATNKTLTDYIYKDGNTACIAKDDDSKDAKIASLEYSVVNDNKKDVITRYFSNVINEDDINDVSVLDIKLLTGRFHQIRCQLSNMGHPIVGDKTYGSIKQSENRKAIGLIAYSLEITHPKTGKREIYVLN